MNLKWEYTIDTIDWDKLSHLYKIAPLGTKKPEDLQVTFRNSRYVCFVYDVSGIIGVGRVVADS